MSLPHPRLPIWMDGPRVTALRTSAWRWWNMTLQWLNTPWSMADALSAPLGIVDLYAYQRGIVRFATESERLYRLRVHHALANARDAGTIVGMERIFQRLELPVRALEERLPGYDWDMYAVQMTPEQFAVEGDLLALLLQMYGRTCRRPLFKALTPPVDNYIALFQHAGEIMAIYPRSLYAVDADIPMPVIVTIGQTASETTVINVRRVA